MTFMTTNLLSCYLHINYLIYFNMPESHTVIIKEPGNLAPKFHHSKNIITFPVIPYILVYIRLEPYILLNNLYFLFENSLNNAV